MKDVKHWVNLIENDLRDDQSLTEQERVLKSYVEQIQYDVFDECLNVANAHIGSAERSRIAKWGKHKFVSDAAWESIRDEERGENIAAKEIYDEIKRRMVGLTIHHENCDVNDPNIEGIEKPCNCEGKA